jgi:hypothetical protein
MKTTVKTALIGALFGMLGSLLAGGAAEAIGNLLALPQANGSSLWVGTTTISANQFLQVDSSGKYVVGNAGGGSGAPTTADYLVKTADAGLSAERVVTDTANLVWDWGTAGQAKGNVQFGTSGSVACVGNDARLSDSRAPNGSASGDLSGSYPGPTVAAGAVTFAKMQDVSATGRILGRITAGAGDPEELTGTQATTLLDAFTSSLKGLAPSSGGGTSNFLRADGTWAAPGGGASPAWHGDVYGAYGSCDPGDLLQAAQSHGTVAATPTNITTSIARCCFFRPPADITVDRIRFYGVGATTGIYRVAIYRYSDLVRLAVVNDFNTSANAWGSAGSNLNLSLTAGTLYFLAVAVDTTGTTAGIACMGPTVAATTGQVQAAPQSLPGNLDADAGFLTGYQFQFAVTTGALPDPAATLAAQAAWTGGMPAFWLDASDL